MSTRFAWYGKLLVAVAFALGWQAAVARGDIAPPPIPPDALTFSDGTLKIQTPPVQIVESEPGSVSVPARITCLNNQGVQLVGLSEGSPAATHVSGGLMQVSAASNLTANPVAVGYGYQAGPTYRWSDQYETNALLMLSVGNVPVGAEGSAPYNQSTYDLACTLRYRLNQSQSYVDLPFSVRVTALSTAPLFGDANLDGTVDVSDLSTMLTNYRQWYTMLTWSEGDFNHDGTVDIADLSLLLRRYGNRAGASSAAASPPAIRAVPEPSSLVLIAAASVALLRLVWPGWKQRARAP